VRIVSKPLHQCSTESLINYSAKKIEIEIFQETEAIGPYRSEVISPRVEVDACESSIKLSAASFE
jgi:hypothetical protein